MLWGKPSSFVSYPSCVLIGIVVLIFAINGMGEDKSIRINLPKHTKPTPVQKLNRDGVEAIKRHQYEKARTLFYKAYLLDPNDPFTLNNLGYVSELEGNVDRAGRFYDLAQQQNSDATVDLASSRSAEGKPLSAIAGNASEVAMQVNRVNISAVSLLLQGRAPEADLLLQNGLKIDPHNAFILNNLGFAREKEGELESALSYYSAAATLDSKEPVIVTVNKDWRGKAISSIAAENASRLRKLMATGQTPAARLARLNLEGVSAMNRNDRAEARQYFQQAYQLDPGDAFTLNNMGFLAEMDGDRETADFYYGKAREARGNNATVTVATRADAEGKRVRAVAGESDQAVAEKIQADQELKRRQTGPIELQRRPESKPAQPGDGGTPVPQNQP